MVMEDLSSAVVASSQAYFLEEVLRGGETGTHGKWQRIPLICQNNNKEEKVGEGRKALNA